MTTVRRAWIGSLEITDYPYGLQLGADLGSPDSDVVTLESLLADGQIESLVRRLNRGMTLGVVVDGADLAEVQANEAALVIECDRRQNTFTLDLGDGYAEQMVFETTVIEPIRVTGDGSDERDMANMHLWSLAIKAQPFWRSATLTIDDAGTPPSSGGTLLDNCESTTGWAATQAGSSEYIVDSVIYAEGAGSVRSKTQRADYITATGNTTYYAQDKVSGRTYNTGSGGYLAVRVRFETAGSLGAVLMTSGGVAQDVTSSVVATDTDANGFVRYVWPVGAGLTVTDLEFRSQQGPVQDFGSGAAKHVWYDDVELLPAATTDHQIVKQLQVEGSARTAGSLRISAPSEVVALGQVLAITAPTDELPAGFQPDGRRWVAQGTTTTDTTALGGSYFTPTTTYSSAAGYPIFDVPANMLTAGPYTMVALVKAESSSLTFGVQAQLRISSTNTGPTSAAEVSLTGLTTGWQFVTVGTVYLPPLPMQGADVATKVRLLFKGAKMANVYYIPAWQVGGRSVADFSIVDCGTGTVGAGLASSSLWIKSPDTANPQGAWLRGPTTDGLNMQSAWPDAKKPGVHVFRPGALTLFLISLGAAGPTAQLEYYRRYL